MRTPSRRLLVLLCVAVLGVLLSVGLVVAAVAGGAGVAGYAALAALLVAYGVVRGRRVLAPPPLPAGRTCTCCTATHYDPVKVV